MERLDLATTNSADLPHLHSSFPSSILSHRKPPLTMCSASISPFSYLLSFLHPKCLLTSLDHSHQARSKQTHSPSSPGPAISPRPHNLFWLPPHFSVPFPGKLLQQVVYACKFPFVTSHSIISLLSLVYTLWSHKLVFVKTIVNPSVAQSWGPSAHLQLT